MQSFKKFIFSFISILVVISCISSFLFFWLFHSDDIYVKDANLRRELKGKIDFFVAGASQAMEGYDSRIIDKELDVCSYNLSTPAITLDGTYYLLSKEMRRNPVKTVLLEISHETLYRNKEDNYSVPDANLLKKLDTSQERLYYLLRYSSIDQILNIYSSFTVDGINSLITSLKKMPNTFERAQKGYFEMETTASIKPSELNETELSTDYLKQNINALDQIVTLCKKNNCRLVLVVTPLSECLLQQYSEWDNFYYWIYRYAVDNELELYDMNLFKTKTQVFDEKTSFYDDRHLSTLGAKKNTETICSIIRKCDAGEDVSQYFFKNYKQMQRSALLTK